MIRRVFLAVLIFGVTACGGDGTGLENIAGLYTLETIDGDPLPVLLVEVGDNKIEVTAGSVTLNTDRTCSDSLTLEITEGGNVDSDVATDECTYTTDGRAITLTYTDNTVSVGTIIGSALTITDDAVAFLFRR